MKFRRVLRYGKNASRTLAFLAILLKPVHIATLLLGIATLLFDIALLYLADIS